MKKILVVTPHTDDELFGLGGTLLKLKEEQNIIKIILMSGSKRYLHHLQREVSAEEQWEEFKNVCKEISTEIPEKFETNDIRLEEIPQYKIVRWLDKVFNEFNPDVLFFCEPSYHQEHKDVFNACIAASRPTFNKKNIKEIYLYEIPTSTWSDPNNKFQPNMYVDITNEMEEKIEIFKKYYKIQYTDTGRNKLGELGIRSHAKYRGFESGLENAEAFRIIKFIK